MTHFFVKREYLSIVPLPSVSPMDPMANKSIELSQMQVKPDLAAFISGNRRDGVDFVVRLPFLLFLFFRQNSWTSDEGQIGLIPPPSNSMDELVRLLLVNSVSCRNNNEI